MRRALVIFTALWFLALGAGFVEFAHNAVHVREDARQAHSGAPTPVHDDNNCAVHAQLHQPLIATPAVQLLICAGIFVAFLTQLAPQPVTFKLPLRIDCRGPPCLA